jgi:hypothetical protein
MGNWVLRIKRGTTECPLFPFFSTPIVKDGKATRLLTLSVVMLALGEELVSLLER